MFKYIYINIDREHSSQRLLGLSLIVKVGGISCTVLASVGTSSTSWYPFPSFGTRCRQLGPVAAGWDQLPSFGTSCRQLVSVSTI